MDKLKIVNNFNKIIRQHLLVIATVELRMKEQFGLHKIKLWISLSLSYQILINQTKDNSTKDRE